MSTHPHRRFNPLLGTWVLCSPQRLLRPWEGQKEAVVTQTNEKVDDSHNYDAACKLCPGNERASGVRNEKYTGTYAFTNDFPSIFPPGNPNTPEYVAPPQNNSAKSLFQAENADGLCRVICFSPLHTKTIPELDHAQVRSVVDIWASQYNELSKLEYLKYAQIFENKGAVMGCSNPHPHSQVWSTSYIPDEPARELENSKAWLKKHGTCLFCDCVSEEIQKKERVILENDSFVAVVPFWATWPFETLLLSKKHTPSLSQFDEKQKDDLAHIMKALLTRYDNLFATSFPYSSGIHQAPFHSSEDEQISHFHMHFYPPLLRSASVKKFMVGYEMLANPQRDLTAEYAAQKLREMPEAHYKSQ